MGNGNDEYNDPGASGPAPIPDPGPQRGTGGATFAGAANDVPPGEQAQESGSGDPATGESYASMSKDDLIAEIKGRDGLEVPEEGSGANGNVVKDDLVALLEEDDATRG